MTRSDEMPTPPRLWVRLAQLEEMVAHARWAYPGRACGLLVGRRDPEPLVVVVRPSVNAAPDERPDGAFIDPAELEHVSRLAEEHSLQILASYASAPDAAPNPSLAAENGAGDMDVIVSVHGDGDWSWAAWLRGVETPAPVALEIADDE